MKSNQLRSYVNGLEIIPDLMFTGWQPGFEYTKNLTFKNLNTKSIRIIYKVPQTVFFTTLAPKTTTLSPGTTLTLPITFRPIEKKNYDDTLEVTQPDFQKTFKIPIRAKLPEYKIEVQEELPMGVCSVNDIVSSKIKITNKSELDTYFEWDIKEPFSVNPINGELKGNTSVDIIFSFQPKAALVYDASAILRYGEMALSDTNLFKTLRMRASGKYPHILIETEGGFRSECTLNFNKVLIGQSVTRYFTIANMTEVRTDFHIERDSTVPPFDLSFNCLQHVGTLQPFEKQKIAITYCPVYPSIDTIYDYFNVFSTGRVSRSRIVCKATNDVPNVELDKNVLAFGVTSSDKKVCKTFHIINNSDSHLVYQFDVENEYSSFKFYPENGTLLPHESKLIQVAFQPQAAMIYYKKVACIIQNHDILLIELIGTCQSEQVKPPEIQKKHVSLYYYLRANNLLNNPPEFLYDLYVQNKLFNETSLESVLESSELINSLDNTVEDYLSDSVHSERSVSQKLSRENNEQLYVTVSESYLDFGAGKLVDASEKSITLFNNTKGKLLINWNGSDKVPFSVHPATCDIPPMKSYSFRVKFHPKVADQFYHAKLECYAMYSSLCDYTLLDERFALPSWCLNVTCLGHTFHPSCETFFLPRYTVDSENIVFPVSIRDQPIFRTLTLKNNSSDYPLIFDLSSSSSDASWSIKPHKGMIKKNEHQIFILKYTPRTDAYRLDKCSIMLNYMQKHMLEMPLIGAGLLPDIYLENNGVLYFPPTCKNNTTVQTHEIVNLTRSRIYFEWKIPYEAKKLVSVDLVESHLEPYEKKSCVWRFSPEKIDKYNQRISLLAWIDRNRQIPRVYNLRIIGSCTNGSLQALEMYKDFGSVIVGSSVTGEITVINNNDCSLDFELSVRQTVDETLSNRFVDSICTLEIENPKNHIEARSKCRVRCRLRPIRLINYQFTIDYKILYQNESTEETAQDQETANEQKEILCYMTANGVYPKLNITDIKGLGSAATLNKDYLWKLLSINDLNSSMSCEPNPEELEYSIATRQEVNRRVVNQFANRPVIDMNFNVAPVDSEDTQVMFFVENTGSVRADWSLLFPKDLMLELEYWAQSGDYTLAELENMKIQDNKLFIVEPKRGVLEPGEIVRITITYRHVFVGQDKLPVLMKIAKGREILINLVGNTAPANEPFVYFPWLSFVLKPVEIGLTEYPIQVFEIYNGGSVAAEIEIDDSMLEELNMENYASYILECMSKSKLTIPPRSSVETKWKFSPLEAKTYMVDVLFRVNNKSFHLITFKCIGYDKRKLNNMAIQDPHLLIPEKQKFFLPNQLASLTIDRILFGDVPLFSRERKMLFVKNNSSQHKISFTWHLTNPDHARYVRIQPSRGIIDVSQSKLCKLTFISMGKPAFYNIDLICEIKNETEMDAYRASLDLWKQEQTRQFQEFMIEEKELENRLKDTDGKEDQKVRDAKQQAVSRLGVNQFKTIPPLIKNNLLVETNLTKIRKSREEKKLWKKPLPPNPFLLHLNVIARTNYMDQYLELSNTVKNNSEKYVDPLLGFAAIKSGKNVVEEEIKLEGKIVCSEEESETMEIMLSGLLRDLVNDKSFHQLAKQTKSEEIPLFLEYDHTEATETNGSARDKPDLKSKKKGKKEKIDATQQAKRSPIFSSLVENIIENTLSNILTEAFYKEFSLTNRPRLIALPPKINPNPDHRNSVSHSATMAAFPKPLKDTTVMSTSSFESVANSN